PGVLPGTVVFVAPPAAARTLKRKLFQKLAFAQQSKPAGTLEVPLVIRRGQGVQVLDGRRWTSKFDPVLAAPENARKPLSTASLRKLAKQLGKQDIPLPDHGIVNEGESAEVLGPHLAVPVGSAKENDHLRVMLLDAPRQRQGGNVLLEGRAESDH